MKVTYNKFTEEEFIRNYNRIYKDDMLWFILGSLVSSDNFWETSDNTTEEQFKDLLDKYIVNIYKLADIANNISKCNEIPEVDQNKIKEYAISGLLVLSREMLEVREKWGSLNNK